MSALVEMLLEGGPKQRAGRRRRGGSTVELVRFVRSGVSSERATRAFKSLNLSLEEAARSVGLPVRTLQRRMAERQRLQPVESEKVLRLARVADAAAQALGDRGAAGEWLRAPNTGLGGSTPLSLLDTDIGAAAVLDELLRLEHGVFG